MNERTFFLYFICDYFDYEVVSTSQRSTTGEMINLRRLLEFRYYSRDNHCSGNYSLIAKSPIIEPLDYNDTHVHLFI
jgi:hypothetical protein